MPRAPGRPRDADVDDRVIAAARAVLREGGFDALTVAEVARRAGVGRPTVYRRHADADALALAVLYDDLERVAVQGAPHVPDTLPLADQLIALVAPILNHYLDDRALSARLLLLVLARDASPDDPLTTQLMGFLGEVGARAQRAIARGELRADTDIPALMNAFFALYFMTAWGAVKGQIPDRAAAHATFAAMIRQHLDGVRP